MKKILMLFSLFLITGALVMAQTVQITGTVTSSEDGLPIPGVTVLVKGTTLGSLTGADGKYILSVPTTANTLVFSFIGFKTLDVEIGGRPKIDVVLQLDVFKVDEVVVVGYGVQKKREVTGAISTVRGDALSNLATPSFDASLAGKSAGVQVTTQSGVLGGSGVLGQSIREHILLWLLTVFQFKPETLVAMPVLTHLVISTRQI
jgi:hypothetical protein